VLSINQSISTFFIVT